MALDNDEIDRLVARFARERDRFDKMASMVSRRLSAALFEAAVPHVPTFRAKAPKSLRGKLRRDRTQYSGAEFVPEFCPGLIDLAGVRVLLYRSQDTNVTCDVIEDLFEIPDGERFRKSHDDPHGYQAQHRVVTLTPDDLETDPRLSNLTGVMCEIQVVSLGDHIWNELNHDIKYKTPDGRPSEAQEALLGALRRQLDAVRGTVDQLAEATDRRREENLSLISTAEDLQHGLRVRTGRMMRGDLGRLLELLESSVEGEITLAKLDELGVDSDALDRGKQALQSVSHPATDTDPVLVVGALWNELGPAFYDTVCAWRGKPGAVSRAVRALHDS
ncbi:MAG: RelA/SpoT domain-containing protein [Deltaproteobacteria bacterium]|nr:RelA/SpoT domain-containing protein [Deltaproteobacteria bacterium]